MTKNPNIVINNKLGSPNTSGINQVYQRAMNEMTGGFEKK